MAFSCGKVLVHLNRTSTGTNMPHRELLIESQRLSLQAPASDERGMVRHYLLSSEDLALINRRRGDPNRLGFALTLCYLRFPGRILQQGEQPPAALCAFVTLADGDLRIAPLRKNTPESAEAFAEKAYALMPHVKITELLAEVDQWTSLGDRFLHLRTQAPPKNRQALLTAILADGINLGLTRMSEACRETTWRQLSWTADWHVREECYAQALAGLIEAQHRQPLAAHWGDGTTSSSDAQFFRAGGRGEVGGLVNLQ